MTDFKTSIFYHGDCPDGFGGAYAAWKKFGDTAEYIGLKHERPFTHDVAGKDIYFIDFCYPEPKMRDIIAQAGSVTVLDHHEGVQEVIERMPAFVYDASRSGATIAWNFFHPDSPTPYFLQLVEKADRYQPLTDEERALITYTYARPFGFSAWDELVAQTEDPETRASMMEKGRAYSEYYKLITAQMAESAKLVTFEGHTVYLATAPGMFATEIGSLLRKKQPPFALIIRAEEDGNIRVSMRGDASVDLSKIAQKYGGNGHPGSAAFLLTYGTPLPWTLVQNETLSN